MGFLVYLTQEVHWPQVMKQVANFVMRRNERRVFHLSWEALTKRVCVQKHFPPEAKPGGGGSVQRWAWSFKGGQPDRKLAQSQDKRAWLMGIVLRAPERTLELKIGSSQIYKSMLRREVGVIRSNFNFRFRHGQQSAVFDAHFQRYLWQHHARTVIRATWPQGKLPSAYYRWGQRLHRARFASG